MGFLKIDPRLNGTIIRISQVGAAPVTNACSMLHLGLSVLPETLMTAICVDCCLDGKGGRCFGWP
jgi:hypothetical protein